MTLLLSTQVFAADEENQKTSSTAFFGLNAEKTTEAVTAGLIGVQYRGHIQNLGNMPKPEGSFIEGPNAIGTRGESLRIEGFWINLTGAVPEGAVIKYNVHVQNIGWLYDENDTSDWATNGKFAGTTGQSLRIEAVKISLDNLPGYDVYYRGHVENQGNMPQESGEWSWVKNGEMLGTAGSSLRLEELEIKIVKKAAVVYDAAGIQGPETGVSVIDNDVRIQADGVTLQNLHISGDLIISEEVGDGDVTLNNVTVDGDTIIRGGGENSIHINSGSYNKILIEKTPTGKVRVVGIGVAGSNIVLSEDADGETVVLEGFFENVEINAPNAAVQTQGDTTIQNMTVGKQAAGVAITLDTKTTVADLVLDGKAEIKGKGTINNANINANSVVFEKAPQQQTVAPEVSIPPVVVPPEVPETPGSGGSSSVYVTNIDVTGEGDATSVCPGETLQMLAAITPENASNQKINWSITKKTGDAEIDRNGLLTAVSDGTVTVKATATDGSGIVGEKEITIVSKLISIKDIAGVPLPTIGGTPASQIQETAEYTGIVIWNKSDNPFKALTEYTATITITPKMGYTLSGIPADFFTLADAQTSNNENSGTVSAIFPKTGDASGFTAAFENNYSKLQGQSFNLMLTDAKDADGNLLNGNKTVTVGTDQSEGQVYHQDTTFSGGKATIPIKLTTLREHNLSVAIDGGASTQNLDVYIYSLVEYNTDSTEPTITITGYDTKYGLDVVIPPTINGKTVITIGESAFASKNITELTLPEGIITIGKSAFFSNKLTNLVLPERITTIDQEAFKSNKLTGVTIPTGATIGEKAFLSNQLTSISLADNVTVGWNAFYNNDIVAITIGENVTIISASFDDKRWTAFKTFFEGSAINRAAGSYEWDGYNWYIPIVENPFVFNGATGTITRYEGNDSIISIPTTIQGHAVTAIGDNVFRNKKLTNVTIPDGITAIGSCAFYDNRLNSVDIPASVKTIGYHAFSINYMENVTMTEGLETIGPLAFVDECFKSIIIPAGVKTIGESAFWQDSELASVTIPDNVTIEKSAFVDSPITSVTIGNNVTITADDSLGTNGAAFKTYYESSTGKAAKAAGTYTFADGSWHYNQTIMENGFTFEAGTGTITGYTGTATEVTIPAEIQEIRVTTIGDNVFAGKKLIGVTIPEGITTIGVSAFENNTIGSITIPESITTMGESAFADNHIRSITIPNGVTVIQASTFANNWLSSVTISEGVTTIGASAFAGNNGIASITIPNSVTSIGADAFDGNPIRNITIGSGVDIQGTDTMGGYSQSFITLYGEKKIGGKYMYYQGTPGVWKYTEVTDSNGLIFDPTIGTITGYNLQRDDNRNDKSLTIPATINGVDVIAIGDSKLAGVRYGITSVVLPDTIKTIGNNAFFKCPITQITIGAEVNIGSDEAMGTQGVAFKKVYDDNGKTAGTYKLEDYRWIKK